MDNERILVELIGSGGPLARVEYFINPETDEQKTEALVANTEINEWVETLRVGDHIKVTEIE